MKKKLLLHVCCIGCGAYASQALAKDFRVTLYYYNPCIFPAGEYRKRLAEAERVALLYGLEIVTGAYSHKAWLDKVKGRENDPERGERCRICCQDRLRAAAEYAAGGGFSAFSTTLTVSPHKDAAAINKIGRDLESEYNIIFLKKDFKKQNGFKQSLELSRKLNLYRQNYCGCEFSQRK